MLGYLGYPGAQTPNLDNIIKEDAVAFNNAFVKQQFVHQVVAHL